jgi:hypothetical protein
MLGESTDYVENPLNWPVAENRLHRCGKGGSVRDPTRKLSKAAANA